MSRLKAGILTGLLTTAGHVAVIAILYLMHEVLQ